MRKQTTIIDYLFCLGLAFVVALFIYPSFTDSLNNIFMVSQIDNYANVVDLLPYENVQKIKDKARKYNEKIFQQQKESFFYYQGDDKTDAEYESILSVKPGSDLMGYIDVPTANIYLPISHGTKNNILKNQAGHMYGTSVPIDGESVKAIIAGHTGLQEADIFTHLTDVKKGDEFFVHVLDDIYEYEVFRIDVVLPEEEIPYMQVEEGKDIVMLYTCTPYGVNDHRLLIQGRYTRTIDANSKGDRGEIRRQNNDALTRTILYGLLPFVVLIVSIVMTRYKNEKASNIVR